LSRRPGRLKGLALLNISVERQLIALKEGVISRRTGPAAATVTYQAKFEIHARQDI
jgi:hypothetical protein